MLRYFIDCCREIDATPLESRCRIFCLAHGHVHRVNGLRLVVRLRRRLDMDVNDFADCVWDRRVLWR